MSTLLSALNQTRTDLFDLNLIGTYANGVGYGNLSVRMLGNQFIVTASATGGLRTLGQEHYCLVEEFSEDQNYVRSIGALPASSEAMTHGAIYAANTAVHCVVHVHCKQLFDYCLVNARLATPAIIPYGTPAMAHAVSELVRAQHTLPVLFAMAGHEEGIVAYGADVASTHALLLNELHRSKTP
jgi:ribulose-5-phosphate 4-epimerase/fuculose-1-phosphate aldolase